VLVFEELVFVSSHRPMRLSLSGSCRKIAVNSRLIRQAARPAGLATATCFGG
jgi:hypothetical protein